MAPTTARILVDRALETTCDQACVNWALKLMEDGVQSPTLPVLAGATHPYNHFELAAWRDTILSELGIKALPLDAAVRNFAVEVLQDAISKGDQELIKAITDLKDVCIAADYDQSIYEFYTLYFAYDDLKEMDWSGHLRDATRSNILPKMRAAAKSFLSKYGKTESSA